MSTENNNLPAINVQEFTNVIKTAPDVLQRNEMAVSKCNAAGQTLLDTIESVGGIDSDELDQSVADYISKVKVTVDNMNTRRKPLTQLLTAISKRFTSLESDIDFKSTATIPYKLQDARNKFAAKKIAAQKAKEEEARKTQALEKEITSYKTDLAVILDETYSDYVTKHIGYLNGLFTRLTVDNYNEAFRQIKEASIAFVWEDFVKNVKDSITTYYMSSEKRTEIKKELATAKKKEYVQRYEFEIDELKQSLIERLPSQRKALEEEAELRKQDTEAAEKAEAERKQREADEAKKADEARKRQEQINREKVEASKATAEAQAAFNFMSASVPDAPIKAKVKKKINVVNPKGFIEIYQLWFVREGANLPMDELEKVHKKMITFCEKEANKDNGEFLKSAFIEYIDDVKAK